MVIPMPATSESGNPAEPAIENGSREPECGTVAPIGYPSATTDGAMALADGTRSAPAILTPSLAKGEA